MNSESFDRFKYLSQKVQTVTVDKKMITDETKCISVDEEYKIADKDIIVTRIPKLTLKDSLPQVVGCCAINLVVIQAGINMSFSSILIPQLSAPESDIEIDLDSSSTVASIVTLSIALGALFCGPLMDKFGRK